MFGLTDDPPAFARLPADDTPRLHPPHIQLPTVFSQALPNVKTPRPFACCSVRLSSRRPLKKTVSGLYKRHPNPITCCQSVYNGPLCTLVALTEPAGWASIGRESC